MKPLLYPTYLGRSWALRNDSSRPDAEVEELLGFALAQTRGLGASGAVLVKDPRADGHGAGSGEAGDRSRNQRIPKWVNGRVRYYLRLTIPGDDWAWYGHPRVCWHSTEATRLWWELGRNGYREHLRRLHADGQTKLGRWPIYVVNDWREEFVHLASHEVAHLVQYDLDRGAGGSEVFCETFALEALNRYRAARPCGDELSSLILGGSSPDRPHAGSQSPTNRKEPTVATSTSKTADPKAEMKGLFDTLIGQVQAIAPKTAKVEKSAYVRVDLLLDDTGKHKTLAYVNHPTTKSVRVEIPKKAGGGYDVVKVTKAAEVEKAVKAVRANHDRIVAQAAA